MPVHLPQRMHAFVHGLFRSSDETETRELYAQVKALFGRAGLDPLSAQLDVAEMAANRAAEALGIPPGHPQHGVVRKLAIDLLAAEGHFTLPDIDWTERRSITAWWELRDELNAQRPLLKNFEQTVDLITDALVFVFRPLLDGCPALLETSPETGGIRVPTNLLHSHTDLPGVLEHCLQVGLDEDIKEAGLFPKLTDRLERNLVAASGGNPADPGSFTRQPKTPSQSEEKDPARLVQSYLAGTPLSAIFDQTVTYTIPQSVRFEHHHLVAGSGHGKTQTLQYLIANDLEAVAAGEQSVVVLDSQGDLIRNIAGLKEFAPGGPLHDRVVIIDPTDVEYPVSLNLFDVGLERLQEYPLLERERLTNSILELYDFVLGTLLDAQMTQKQNVIFRYVTRLMLHIPDATIHTLRELMEPGSEVKFAGNIAKLEGTAKHFFETEFSGREFEQTKKQVLRRLWGILENQTFERMFSHPRSKLDLFSELNAGKVILINTAKDLLKEQGSQIFGRFFIALIAQAAQERATLKERDRIPTLVYIDEAADYFDRNIGLILAQARKYKVGMVLAHQYLGQLEPKLQEAFAANTSIKFAGGVSAKDARSLAPMLYTDASLIERQPKGSFAAYARGVSSGAVPLSFPLGFLEAKERMDRAEGEALKAKMRDRYAVHYTKLAEEDEADQPEESQDADDDKGDAEEPGAVYAKPEDKPKDDGPSTDASDQW
ncbi:type IV secretory system conjugative DNA transfer family protein [Primorskyibacter sp. S187A]|uniref:type IV secretory system conjugative DNA transfer family protein n=1 Tax=Primorskyibacter sp. S187A TaxID=3415130 RepID=UPI003C7C7878